VSDQEWNEWDEIFPSAHKCSDVHPSKSHSQWKTEEFVKHYSLQKPASSIWDEAVAQAKAAQEKAQTTGEPQFVAQQKPIAVTMKDALLYPEYYGTWTLGPDGAQPAHDLPVHGHGYISVSDCPQVSAFKVEWTPPKMSYLISYHLLDSDIGAGEKVMQMVAKELGKYADSLVHSAMKEYLGKVSNTGTAVKATVLKKGATFLKALLEYTNTADTPIGNYLADFTLDSNPAAEVFLPDSDHGVVYELEKLIPGFRKMKEPCPVEECPDKSQTGLNALLHGTVMHLNDKHKWTREHIADWLDTLDHDLTFKTPEEVNSNGSTD
jgi:hypothetical protein